MNNEKARKRLVDQPAYKRLEKTYWGELHAIIDELTPTVVAKSGSVSGAAKDALMASGTLAKLRDHQTRWPQFWTVYRLARAAGFELVTRAGRAP